MASTHDYEIDSRNNNIQIYIDGEFFSRADAKVSVMDSGYLLEMEFGRALDFITTT